MKIPTFPEYRAALGRISPDLTDADRNALAFHARKLDLDVLEIAAAAGVSNEHWTYAEYGQIGELLTLELGGRRPADGIWTRTLGTGLRDPKTGLVRWKMHRALATAVLRMPWARDARANHDWGIRKKHVLAALKDLDQGVKHPFHDSTGYDLIYRGRRYPPKAILGLAAKHSSNASLRPRDFSGGEKSKCVRILRTAGFEVEPKPDSVESSAR